MRPFNAYMASNRGAGVGPATDPYFAYVKSLLHFDSDWRDRIAGHTFSPGGGASIDTGTYKWGPGGMACSGSNASISATDATNFPVGTADFTYEGWANASSLGNTGIFTTSVSTSHNGIGLGYYTGTGKWQISYGQATALELGTSPALTTGLWVHWFVQRIGGVLYMGAAGTVLGSVACTTNFTDTGIAVGVYYGPPYAWNGYLDDFRFTNGVGRYPTSGSYTIPTAQFPDS